MPKSKEFVEDSDSDDNGNAKQATLSDDETEKKPVKKAKTSATTSKNEVSKDNWTGSRKKNRSFVRCLASSETSQAK